MMDRQTLRKLVGEKEDSDSISEASRVFIFVVTHCPIVPAYTSERSSLSGRHSVYDVASTPGVVAL